MSIPDTVVLDVPSLLTAAGVAVGLLSAVYAWRSAREARRQAEAAEASLKETRAQSALARATLNESKTQNRIATHGHRLDAYKELLGFQGAITRNGVHFKQEATWSLFDHARLAEFYFSQAVSTAMNSIVDMSIEIQHSREAWGKDAVVQPGERTVLVASTHALLDKLRYALRDLDEARRQELRIEVK
jgi:hypothetical protein